MKKVMAFGTFDIFHKGHESYLKQAKELGSQLIVVVARDETVTRIKNQPAKNNECERLEKIELSGLADEVLLGKLKNRYAVIEKHRPDIIALGYDQRVDMPELREKLKEFKLNAKIVRLKSFEPQIYKSSKLREK
jgi:FAD synthetase